MDKMPCRVAVDLQRYQAEQTEHGLVAFDEYDDDLMHDVVGNDRLAKPVQALLVTRAQLKRILGSFGHESIDKGKLLDLIMPELDSLYTACADEWKDQ